MMNTKFLSMNIPYNEVKNVVVVRIIYVRVLALGFLCRRSFMVGTNHKKVIIQPTL